jgi:hypothetical protein
MLGLALACPATARACTGDPELAEGSLRAALEERSSISRVRDHPDPATYKRYIERALRRTFDELAGTHTCAIYASGESRFSVHAFAIEPGPGRDAIVKQVEQRKARSLQIEQLVIYAFLPTDSALIFLIAPSAAELGPLLDELKQRAEIR